MKYRLLSSQSIPWLSHYVLIVYGLLTLWIGIFYFEPWRDIAHVWVVVRDSPFFDIFGKIPSNSHPFLWFLLVKPLVILGLPYQSSVVLNILCCISAVYLLLYKAPLPQLLKICFIFSYPMIYEFTFPGRIYALGILLTFLICSFLSKIEEKPIFFAILLALSFHTHFLFLAFSCPISVYFIHKNFSMKRMFQTKYLISFSILILSALYFFWYIYALRKNYNEIFISDNKNNIIEIANQALTLGQPQFTMLSFLTLLLFFMTQLKKFSALIISTFALSFMFYAFLNVLPQFNRYYQIFPIILMALIWFSATITPSVTENNTVPKQNLKQMKRKPQVPVSKPYFGFFSISQLGFYILFAGCLLLSSFKGINAVHTEYKLPHSDSKSAATFIEENLLDYVLVGHRSYIASALVPYLPKDKSIWYADRKEFGTFLKFDSVYHKTNISVLFPAAIESALKQFPNEQKLALILSIPLQQQFAAKWKLVYSTKGAPIQRDESYFIYVLQ